MNTSLLHTPEGVRDIHCHESSKKNELQNRIQSVFHRYGFKDIQTPTFEYYDVFNHDKGSIDSKKMYKFFDREGNILALRPDITPSIARYVSTFHNTETTPIRLCYLGNTFRDNERYQGKLREFTQAGVELIGPNSSDTDAEMIALVVNSFKIAGLEEFQIDIGQAEFFKGIVEEAGLDSKIEEELRQFIDEKNYFAAEEVLIRHDMEEAHKKVFMNLPKLFGSIEVLENARKLTVNKRALKALDRLQEVYEILCDYNMEKYISFDLGIVNQLDYYTGVIFRGYTYGTGASIIDGGRYDTLLKIFGKDTKAIGFAIEIDSLMMAMESQNIKLPILRSDTLLLYKNTSRKIAISIAEEYRSQGMNIEVGMLNKSLEDNISFGKKQNIGGIMNFIDDNNVQLINLENMEITNTTVKELLSRGEKE